MSIFRRSMTTAAAIGAVGAIAAGSSIPALAATTSGVRYDRTYVSAGWLGPGKPGEEAACSMVLLSAAASGGSPAYVSGLLESSTSDKCTGFLQHSVSDGAWTDVSPQVTLPGTDQGLVNYPWAKTGDYYAGPGTKVRACVLTPAIPGFPSKTECSSGSVTLAASGAAAPASDGTPVLYAHNNQTVNILTDNSSGQCSAYLSSSTTSKTKTSQANLTLFGLLTPLVCTGWLELSTNNGKTWQQATPTYSATGNPSALQNAFSPAVADGTGHLARACVKFNATKKCTAAW